MTVMISTMTANASNYDWPTWWMGIMRSFVGGAAGAISGFAGPMMMDYQHFNFGPGLRSTLLSMGIGALIAGAFAMAVFLKTHSGPDRFQQALADAAIEAAKTTTQAAKAQDAVAVAQAQAPEKKP
jgi:hypothetical protein